MAKATKKKSGTESLTEAVLRLYDKGIQSPPAILSELMMTYPALTRYSIGNIIAVHRPPKPVVEAKPVKPKLRTEREILEEVMLHKCATCRYHTPGVPCVAPSSACPFPEMDSDWKRLKELMLKEQEKALKPRKKKEGETARKPRLRGSNIFDILEAEIEYRNNHRGEQEDGGEGNPGGDSDDIELPEFKVAGDSSFMGIEMPGFVDDAANMPLIAQDDDDIPFGEDALDVMSSTSPFMQGPSFKEDEDEEEEDIDDNTELDDITEVDSDITVANLRAVLSSDFYI